MKSQSSGELGDFNNLFIYDLVGGKLPFINGFADSQWGETKGKGFV